MPNSFICPHCGETSQVADQFLGRGGKCPGCGETVTMPGAPALQPPAEAALPAEFRSRRSALSVVLLMTMPVGLLAVIGVLLAVLLPAINGAREDARRMVCQDHLRKIAAAMQLHDQQHGALPPAYLTKQGHRQSWRVQLLPFMEQRNLHDAYHADESWDGLRNASVLARMPDLYRCPTDAAEISSGIPNYFVVTSRGAVFDGDQAESLATIAAHGGQRETLLVAEAVNTGIRWLEPRDLRLADIGLAFDIQAGKSISSFHTGGANIALADGSCKFLPATTDIQVLRSLVMYQDGQSNLLPQ